MKWIAVVILVLAGPTTAASQSDDESVPRTDVERNCSHRTECIVAEQRAYNRVREIWGRVNGYSQFVCRMSHIGFGASATFYRGMVPCLENALFNQEGFEGRKAKAQGFRE